MIGISDFPCRSFRLNADGEPRWKVDLNLKRFSGTVTIREIVCHPRSAL